jgi:transcriptional regulator with XRE-family HTH domain
MKTEIGAAIKKDRESLGLSQTEFSELLGASKNSISYWERGICSPYIENIMQLIQVLGHYSHVAKCVREKFKSPDAESEDKEPVAHIVFINGAPKTVLTRDHAIDFDGELIFSIPVYKKVQKDWFSITGPQFEVLAKQFGYTKRRKK